MWSAHGDWHLVVGEDEPALMPRVDSAPWMTPGASFETSARRALL